MIQTQLDFLVCIFFNLNFDHEIAVLDIGVYRFGEIYNAEPDFAIT